MEDSSVLFSKRDALEKKIRAIEQKISDYEDAYDSLSYFKNAVENSGEDFQGVNNAKLKEVSSLKQISKNCKTAERYLNGSNKTLDGIGGKIVGVSFWGLRQMIEMKRRDYKNKITECEIQKGKYRSELYLVNCAISAIDALI